MNNIKFKQMLAIASFIAGCTFGMMGLWIAPTGIIHQSVLIMTAQLLFLSATFLGIDIHWDLSRHKYDVGKKYKEDKEDETNS